MTESAWTAFQLHRHDVQNYMQLVKAYLQLGKPEKALDAANQCADWLTSLSRLQSQLREDTPGDALLLWTAASCSHVRVSLLQFSAVLDTSSLCEGISWLDQQAAVHNSKYIHAKLSSLPSTTQDSRDVDASRQYGHDAETVASGRWHIMIDGPDLDSWWSSELAREVPQGLVVTIDTRNENAPQGQG